VPDYEQVALFMLVFARISAFMVTAPLFVQPNVPVVLKAGLAVLLAILLFPVVEAGAITPPETSLGFILALVVEIAIGLALGFITSMIFASLSVAGQYIDIKMGFFMSFVFDPMSGTQTTIMARFLVLVGLVLFLNMDGHHMLLAGLARSFDIVPVMGAQLQAGLGLVAIRSFTGMITVAVQIAAPVMAVVIIVDISLGLIGRTVPQMNIFMLGFTVKIFLGILTMSIMVPLMGAIFRSLFNMMERDMYLLLKGLS
jgi:flagellar biosynthetic protein FliR